jgi:anti-anti-sigma factor
MPDEDATFLVNAYADPVVVRIQGRANFMNAAPLNEFMRSMMAQGRTRFVIDFRNCTGMDSTFLGILAGAGIELQRMESPGRMLLTRLGARNRDLVENLGLDCLMEIDTSGEDPGQSAGGKEEALNESESPLSNEERAKFVLEAHENLIEADANNAAKFQDVIAFLRNQAES